MHIQLVVVSLRAEDVPQAAHFYRDVIGLPLVEHHEHQLHFDLGGTYLVIVKGQPTTAREASPAPFPLLAFAVADLDGALARLYQHGVEFPWGIQQNGTSRWVKFYDLASNLIELVEFGQAQINDRHTKD